MKAHFLRFREYTASLKHVLSQIAGPMRGTSQSAKKFNHKRKALKIEKYLKTIAVLPPTSTKIRLESTQCFTYA